MTVPVLNEENFRAWIARLRSGEVKQGRSCLRDVDDRYCCIGVMMDLVPGVVAVGNDYDYIYRGVGGSATGMIEDAWQWLFGVDSIYSGADIIVDYPFKMLAFDGEPVPDLELSAMMMNDSLRLSFDQIADMFEYFGVRVKDPEPAEPEPEFI